jgi:PAS domain S-box-containing protein
MLLRDSHIATALLDPQFNFIRVNQAYARACGHPPEFFVGKGHFELYPSNAQTIFEEVVASKQAHEIRGRPFDFPDDDARGTTYWDWKLQPLTDDAGEVEALLFSLHDVTARYRTHLELGRAGVAVVSAAGAIFDVNSHLCELLGRPRGDLRGRPWAEVVHPDDRERAATALVEACSDPSRTADRRVRLATADRPPCHALLSLSCVLNNVGEADYFVLHVHDRNAEVRAQEQKERFFNLSVDLLCIVDYDGRFTDVNDAWERTLGYTREELLGRPLLDLVEPEDHAMTLDEAERLHVASTTHAFTNRYRTKSGAVRWLMWSAVAHDDTREIIAVARDVTEVKRYEAALLEHRERLSELVRERTEALVATESRTRHLLARGPAVVYTCEPAGDFAMTYVSPNVREVLGIAPERFTERADFWLANVHPDDAARIQRGLADLADLDGRGTELHEYRFRRADGVYRWIRDEFRLLRDDDGAAAEIVGYWIDITERRSQMEALREARDAAEQASRAKSDFLSRMSHELRTPMNAILGFGELLGLERERLSANQREGLGHIMGAGRHLLTLIDGVLQLAKIDAGQEDILSEAIAVDDVTARCEALVRPSARRREVTIERAPCPGLYVRGDAVRLMQVLVNLLTNAIKYNRRGGRVRLAAEAFDGRVRISVEDTGAGIDARELPRLFDPFYRVNVNTTVEGSGIGLSICRRLVELMGGSIGVASEPGVGSEFWIELPQETADADAPAPTTEALRDRPLPEAPADRSVLYVEDNQANRRLMEILFSEHLRIPLRTAPTAEEGLVLAKAERPALILMDLDLPGMDGYQAAQLLSEDPALASIPLVAVSAHGMSDYIERAQAVGFDDYLVKPLNLTRTLEAITRLLEQPPRR